MRKPFLRSAAAMAVAPPCIPAQLQPTVTRQHSSGVIYAAREPRKDEFRGRVRQFFDRRAERGRQRRMGATLQSAGIPRDTAEKLVRRLTRTKKLAGEERAKRPGPAATATAPGSAAAQPHHHQK